MRVSRGQHRLHSCSPTPISTPRDRSAYLFVALRRSLSATRYPPILDGFASLCATSRDLKSSCPSDHSVTAPHGDSPGSAPRPVTCRRADGHFRTGMQARTGGPFTTYAEVDNILEHHPPLPSNRAFAARKIAGPSPCVFCRLERACDFVPNGRLAMVKIAGPSPPRPLKPSRPRARFGSCGCGSHPPRSPGSRRGRR